MAYIFCVTSMVYYGLSLNVGSLSGSIYMNTFISGIVEFPSHGFAQVCVDILGRQKTFVPPHGNRSCRCTFKRHVPWIDTSVGVDDRAFWNCGFFQHDLPVHDGAVPDDCALVVFGHVFARCARSAVSSHLESFSRKPSVRLYRQWFSVSSRAQLVW